MSLLTSSSMNLTSSPAKKGVKGKPIGKVGVGSIKVENAPLRAHSTAMNIDDKAALGVTRVYTLAKPGSTYDGSVALDGTITTIIADGNNAIQTGDRVLYNILYGNNDSMNYIMGLCEGRIYFAIRGVETEAGTTTSFKLARTKADALAGNAIKFGSTDFFSSIHKFKHLTDYLPATKQKTGLTKLHNSLFDYGLDTPNVDTLNFFPPGDAENRLYSYNHSTTGTVPDWRRRTALLINGTFAPYPGTEWLQNTPPFRGVTRNNIRQSKIISLYGATTLTPNNIAHFATGGFSGFYNINEKARTFDKIVSNHTTNAIKDNAHADVVLAGNANYWVQHEWFQNITDSHLWMRKGGKIRFGAKVRVFTPDQMRINDFAGIAIKIRYYPQGATAPLQHTAYLKVQRAASNISLPTGTLTTANAANYNWGASRPEGLNEYASDQRPAYNPIAGSTVEELGTYKAEDLGTFQEISGTFTVPDMYHHLINDFQVAGEFTKKTEVSMSLFYSDNCGNLKGVEGDQTTADNVNFNTDISVGDRCYVRLISADTAVQKNMGFEHDGTRFSDFNVTDVSGSSLRGIMVRKAANGASTTQARRVLNENQIRSNGLVAKERYFIDSLADITQAEMHALAGTSPGEEIEPKYMKAGETYTISTLGDMVWGGVQCKNEAFNDAYFVIGVDNRVLGHAFVYRGTTNDTGGVPDPNTTGRVTIGGYPKLTLFTCAKTTSDTKGYFTRTSGSCQFYSPFFEYTDGVSSDFDPSFTTIVGGGTITVATSGPAIGDNFYQIPTGAATPSNFRNSNFEATPWLFFNGGTLTFKALGSGTLNFTFHRLDGDNFGAFTVSKAVSGMAITEYTVAIPARTYANPTSTSEKTMELHELFMDMDERDTDIMVKDVVIVQTPAG